VTLKGKDGKDLNVGNASAVFAADWDGDGALDLLVGNIDGEVWLVPNEAGKAKPPVWGAPRKLETGAGPIRVAHGDAGPGAVGGAGAGRLDLLVGTGEGTVLFFRRLESGGLAAGEPVRGDDGEPIKVFARAKVAAADWNGDGALDLIVG